jgi:hypothetical protein
MAPALVSERQEAKEDDRQDEAFVVRGLDGAPEIDGGLPELADQVGVAIAGRPGLFPPGMSARIVPGLGGPVKRRLNLLRRVTTSDVSRRQRMEHADRPAHVQPLPQPPGESRARMEPEPLRHVLRP